MRLLGEWTWWSMPLFIESASYNKRPIIWARYISSKTFDSNRNILAKVCSKEKGNNNTSADTIARNIAINGRTIWDGSMSRESTHCDIPFPLRYRSLDKIQFSFILGKKYSLIGQQKHCSHRLLNAGSLWVCRVWPLR